MIKRGLIEISQSDDGEIWIQFVGVNAAISLEGIKQKSGPIVKKELEKWEKIVKA